VQTYQEKKQKTSRRAAASDPGNEDLESHDDEIEMVAAKSSTKHRKHSSDEGSQSKTKNIKKQKVSSDSVSKRSASPSKKSDSDNPSYKGKSRPSASQKPHKPKTASGGSSKVSAGDGLKPSSSFFDLF
jgi:hypothetical protein